MTGALIGAGFIFVIVVFIERRRGNFHLTCKATPIIESLVKIGNALNITPNDLLLFEYNAPKQELSDEVAKMLIDCSQEEYKKIIEYIQFVKQQRK